MKKKILALLSLCIVGAFTFLYLYQLRYTNKNYTNKINIDMEPQINTSYLVSCIGYDIDNKPILISITINEPSPYLPENYIGSIEDYAKNAIEYTAEKMGLTLPEEFQDNISLIKNIT